MANSWMAECGCRINDACPLHAAAPALLEALERMVGHVCPHPDCEFKPGGKCYQARAAITLAKGAPKIVLDNPSG